MVDVLRLGRASGAISQEDGLGMALPKCRPIHGWRYVSVAPRASSHRKNVYGRLDRSRLAAWWELLRHMHQN